MADALRELLALLQQFTVETDRYVDTISVRDALHRTDLNALGIMMGAARTGVTVTPGMLRQALNLSSPATTALIDRLDEAGQVRRSRSSVDRRQVHLEMTEKAFETGSRLFIPLAREVEQALSGFTPEELELFGSMMRKVTDATVHARQQAVEDPPE
ncbi:MarR family transcriptional regulator [uncultured Arthrobacter sp.]|uniref:MarR family transcriptional regulator n=1 Tax=uncultured Arthrobacter sp. TaxID=114050 RepID=UPI0026342043|nr:MarR family transcriptional regulator [uncultured Arthrobacter sp.]